MYCAARKESDLAWIRAYGYNGISFNNLEKELNIHYDIIFNTVPFIVLDNNRLELIKEIKPLIIELASKPGGVDLDYAEKYGIKVLNAQGLPGKIAPLTSAVNIRKVLKNVLK